MQWLDNYKSKISYLIMIIVATSCFSIALIWLFLYKLTSFPIEISVVIATLIGLVIGWILFTFLLPRFTKNLSDIVQAIDHIENHESTHPAPVTNDKLTKSVISQVYNIAASSKDITTNIEDRRAYLDAALGLIPISVLFFNRNQELDFANQAALVMLKQESKQIYGVPINKVLDWMFYTDESYDSWLQQARTHKIRDDMFRERVSLILSDGNRLIGDVIAHYEKDESHNIETVVIFIDKTSQYLVDEAQLDFVAIAAHELRGPITVIRGYIDVLEEELNNTLNIEQRSLMQKMKVSSEMLSLYINNILNVARVDQCAMSLHVRKTNWKEVINESYKNLEAKAQAHGRILKLDLPKNIPAVAVDRITVVEVINNLVDNAIKYSKEGGEIVIAVTSHESLVETTVTDHGVGIPEAVIGNLFKKFYRSHLTKSGVTGTGLGLYLSKAIIDAHGGNIWVRSKQDKGTVFGFDLPSYESVADSLERGDNSGDIIKHTSHGWIKNHSMYRR